MLRQYTIIEILDDGVMVQNGKGEIEKLTKINLPRFAKTGDLIRWAEHNFYYVVDKDGNIIDR